ncbi:DUF4111 domain-containing protein [Nonomuraea sp. NN258]|uniref:nucleotidyltransferase domain-containing protein n=1 Tax=Nonomuraea antri TaxID=2730852 RepID=UPI001567D1A6|nr:nucleotidyltransferase domain-containing protein [Nonomuraea antri]NRQ40771.1 DUF4111 domain-containing protein [Nonomuraea antri]
MIHPKIAVIVDSYLDVADSEAPGLVDGLYLEGSAALGDYRPDSSDVDFVAVTSRLPDLEVVERIRARTPNGFDGVYLTWDDLRHDPSTLGERPQVLGTRVAPQQCNPVTWHTLARYGVTCRGPEITGLDVWCDPAALASWTDGNLDHYWRPLVNRSSSLRGLAGLASLSAYSALWIVTGVSRLHYTLATGDLTSKHGAGLHALKTFPERWHRVIREALRIRETDTAQPTPRAMLSGLKEHFGRAGSRPSLYASPLARRRDVLAFANMTITAAHHLHTPTR